MNNVLRTLRMFLWLFVLTGVLYPLLITVIAQGVMSEKANGSLIVKDNKVIGSRFIAQKFESGKYFWPRPSAVDYNAASSGASNLGPTSKELQKQVVERSKKFDERDIKKIPSELLYASASGLDPDISPETAYYQVARIVKERANAAITDESLKRLIDQHTKRRVIGFIGQPVVNVLELNVALDEIK
jgi:K+-transporting ATPase ATPase C chain